MAAIQTKRVELDFMLWVFLGDSRLPSDWDDKVTFAEYMNSEDDVQGFEALQTILGTVFGLDIEANSIINNVAEHIRSEYADKPQDPSHPHYWKTKLLTYHRRYEAYQNLFVNLDSTVGKMLLQPDKNATQQQQDKATLKIFCTFQMVQRERVNRLCFGRILHVVKQFA